MNEEVRSFRMSGAKNKRSSGRTRVYEEIKDKKTDTDSKNNLESMEHSGEEESIANAILALSKDIRHLKTELKQEFNKTEISENSKLLLQMFTSKTQD